MKNYYITTPIYYPSDNLHIGHTYTTVAADTLKKFKQLMGYDVMFVTGTDEHGQKIQQKAKENNLQPKEYVDGIVENIKKLWKMLDISYDVFVRTTDADHEKVVQKIFKKLYDQGDIYKSYYEGLYCTPCESFWTESQLKDGKCPDCGRAVEKAKEYIGRTSGKLLNSYYELVRKKAHELNLYTYELRTGSPAEKVFLNHFPKRSLQSCK